MLQMDLDEIKHMQLSHAQPRAKKWTKLMVFLLIIVLSGYALWHFVLKPKPKVEEYSQWAQPVPVRVVSLSRQDLPVVLKAVGSAVASETVIVQSRISGTLEKLYFKDGDWVKQGQLLALIDPKPKQVALAQAQGNRQNILTQLQFAQSELIRKQHMLKEDAISRQEVDSQAASVRQLSAQLDALRAEVAAADLELSYSKIYAPISGKLGFRQKDVGNLIQEEEENGLVSISKTTPIYVEFAIAENYLDLLRSSLTAKHRLRVEAWDREERQRLAVGEVYALDNQIDSSTGTIKLKAIFSNQDQRLFANQFVNVRLQAQTIHGAVTVPTDAIQNGAQGTYVYVIDQHQVAHVRPLKLGMNSNGTTQVLSGLAGNEQVVLEGIDRLREGKKVNLLSPASTTGAVPPAQVPSSP
jgi:multidrug efflux system membrane fusion protein